jgi:hypothetical protein
MTAYLLSLFQPDGAPPPTVDLDAVMKQMDALHHEMTDADAWVFSAGLLPASSATVVRATSQDTAGTASGDDLLVTDGPFTEGKEHLGGFTIVESADLDEAMGWAAKMARITGLSIEVRPVAFQRARGESVPSEALQR